MWSLIYQARPLNGGLFIESKIFQLSMHSNNTAKCSIQAMQKSEAFAP